MTWSLSPGGLLIVRHGQINAAKSNLKFKTQDKYSGFTVTCLQYYTVQGYLVALPWCTVCVISRSFSYYCYYVLLLFDNRVTSAELELNSFHALLVASVIRSRSSKFTKHDRGVRCCTVSFDDFSLMMRVHVALAVGYHTRSLQCTHCFCSHLFILTLQIIPE